MWPELLSASAEPWKVKRPLGLSVWRVDLAGSPTTRCR